MSEKQKRTEYWRKRYRENIDKKRAQARAVYASRTPEEKERWAKRARGYHLENNYGLTAAAFDAMLTGQSGRCAICRTEEPGGRGWHVDHDHRTGNVRGLLCHGCNTGLGMFRDRPDALLAAVAYLEGTK